DAPFRESTDFGGRVRETGQMYGNDRLGLRRPDKRRLQSRRSNIQRHHVDIDETRVSAGIEHAICRRRKCNSGGETEIAGPNARWQACKMKPGCSAADRNRVARTNSLRERRFKSFDRRPLREEIAAKHRNDGIDVRLVDALPSIAENRLWHSSY